MQNFASGTQISPHFVVDVKLKEHFDFTFPDEDPDADPAVDGPENICILLSCKSDNIWPLKIVPFRKIWSGTWKDLQPRGHGFESIYYIVFGGGEIYFLNVV